ncbi:Cytochrome P450 2H2 [Bulinus truncatus]|nr:Cytochrome P450 2H2 [Bulinus truncatus]
MPPGPIALPYIGNLLTLATAGSNPSDIFMKMKEKYGDIYSLRIGSTRFVVLSDHNLVKEAFIKQADIFSHRPYDNMYMIKVNIQHLGAGLILSSGQVWKELRKITSTALRDFGVGKKSIEEKILEEVHVVLASIENQNGRPFNIKPLLTDSTSNVICNVLFGSRFSYNDPKFMEFHCMLADIVKENPVNVPANFFPWMRHLPHVQKQIQKFLNVFKSADKFIGDQIAEHEATFDPSNLRDFIDLVLDVRMKNTDSIQFTDNNLRNVIVDLFLAGSDTTASTLYWAMLLMADNPDIQIKCQKEIDLVLGVNKEVSLTDRASLIYTEATMMEILRFRTVAQVSFPHCTSCDTELAGYFIPGNTIILANICALHSDAKYWENPELFTPQHFLDANGNITNKDKLMAFSAEKTFGDEIEGLSDKMGGSSDKKEGLSDKMEGLSGKMEGLSDKMGGSSDKMEGLSDKMEGLSGEMEERIQ